MKKIVSLLLGGFLACAAFVVAAEEKVNINTADAATLEALPGIGPKKAEDIVSYREANGPFTSLEALTEVKGIGEKTVEKLADQLTLGEGEAAADGAAAAETSKSD